jgi:hypothetical protein
LFDKGGRKVQVAKKGEVSNVGKKKDRLKKMEEKKI